MIRPRACILAAVLLLCAAMTRHVRPIAAQVRRPVLLIASAATGGGDISLGMLREAFGMHLTERNGKRLVPFNLAVGTAERNAVDRALLGLTPEQVGPFWIDQKIRSGRSAPRSLASPELMLRVVATLRGAIGYVGMNPSAIPTGVVVLTIDGKASSQPQYPLFTR